MLFAPGLLLVLLFQTGASAEQIQEFLRGGDLAAAEVALNQAVKNTPKEWRFKALMGDLRARQERWAEAETAFREAVESAPLEVEPYLRLSRYYQSRKRLESAEQTLHLARSRLGERPAVLHQQALVAIQSKNFLKALALLSRIPSAQAPGGYWETLGRVQASLGNFAAAERAYQRLLEQRPGSIEVLRRLAGFALKQNQFESGWEYIADARRLAPNSPEVLFDFAQVSMAAGLIGEALSSARLLLLLEPEPRTYRLLLARVLMAANEHNQAAEELRRLLEMDAQDGESHLLLGVALNRLGDFAGARSQLEEARRLQEDDTEALYILGLLAYNQTQDEEAESHLTGVLKRKPEHGGAWLALGKLRIRQQRWPEAVDALGRAARLLPQDADVFFQLSRVYRQIGKSEEAQEAVQRYRRLKELQAERDVRAASLPYSRPDPPGN